MMEVGRDRASEEKWIHMPHTSVVNSGSRCSRSRYLSRLGCSRRFTSNTSPNSSARAEVAGFLEGNHS